MPRHLFIVNPAAGPRSCAKEMQEKIAAAFPEGSAEVALTRGAGDATRLTREAAEAGEPVRVYACGGDGTLCEVVNAAAGCPHVAITHVPRGSGNDFLRNFGPGAKERFLDLAALRDGPEAALDLIDCNGRLGLSVACAGVDARVAEDVHRYTSLPLVGGSLAYVLSLGVNVLFKGISRPMEIEMGPIHHKGDVAVLCVCNGRYYGGGFLPMPEAMPDDGVLDMLLIPKVSLLTFAKVVGKYAKGQYKEYPDLITDYHGQSVTFSSEQEITAVIDGEVMHSKRFTIALSDRKVNFFYPAGVHWRGEST